MLGLATSRSTVNRARSAAAKSSVSISLRRGHLAGQYALRARRTEYRPASARHQPSHRHSFTGSAPREIRCSSSSTIRMSSARRTVFLIWAPVRRTRRRNCFLRHPGGTEEVQSLADRTVSHGTETGGGSFGTTRRIVEDSSLKDSGRARAQPEEYRCRDTLESVGLHHGVSGSGKSTLIQDVLYNALCKLKHKPEEPPGRHRAIVGHQGIEDIVMVDQSPVAGPPARIRPATSRIRRDP